jgi:hypothetical protein
MNKYTYIIEKKASKIFELPSRHYQLNILCYSINEDIINPFLLFMVEQKNNCLNFPKLLLNYNEEFNIEDELINIIPYPFVYHGIICDTYNNHYGVVRINKFLEEIPNKNYFVLATEIINNKKIYNYLFSKEIINLFICNPSLYLLINTNTKYAYKLPDVAYKYINSDEENYYLNFGNRKEKFFESCDEYYFFNKSINYSLRHVTIIRYALFTGNKIHFENNDELILNDYEINELLKNDKYKTIIISYLNQSQNHNYPDILVLNYNNFIPLSCIQIN